MGEIWGYETTLDDTIVTATYRLYKGEVLICVICGALMFVCKWLFFQRYF